MRVYSRRCSQCGRNPCRQQQPAADRLSIAVDRTAPTPVIATTAADPTSLESIPFTVDFGESMTPDEFVAAEITLSSGTVTGFATSDDQEFAFNVIEADEGVLTVDVPASVATDLAGSSNAAADRLSIAVDRTAPTPVIATTAADPTSLESIPFTVDFGESMTPDEFVAAEITLSSGTVTGFATSDDQEFAFNVIEADEGVLTVDVPASVATDLAGSSNAAADRLSIAVDRTAPTPVIATTAADPTSLESIPFTVDFGESMTPDEFVAAEITLSSGTVTGFATSDDQEFAFNVIEADEGVLTVDVPASVATDLAGSSNAAADRLSIAVDRTAPTPVIATTAADPTSLESIPFTVDFGESMTPDEFVAAEITLSSGTVTGFATSDDQEFAFNVIEADEGVLTVDVPASVATDLAGSSNAAADRLSIAVDRTAPTPVIATTAADPTSLESIPFTVDFGESMTPDEFVAAEITLSSGTVTGFATSDDQEFAFNVIEADEGVLTVDVPASVATDLAGSSNAAADRLSIAVDRTAPTPVIATTAADPTSLESIPFTVDFGESMTPDEFVAAEITLSSGTVTGFATSDDQEFAFNVIEADEGVLTVDVPASVATDLAGSSNAAADRLSIAVDRTAPTPVIATTAADPTSLESIPFTVDFGESMTPDEFVAAEITLSSGTVTGFATSDDQEFAFNVIEADEGVLTVDVPASVATDLAGSSNAAADRLSIAVDRTAPTPVIATTAADPTSLESIPFTVDFGESMTPDEFVAAEITLSSGTVTGFATSDDQEFAFNVIEADEGVLTVDVPASVATDLAGSSNAAADRLSIAVDRTAPTPVIATTAADPTSLESIPFTVDFGESMTPDEFVAAEITLSSGTVTGFATSDDQEFAFNVIEADEGVLTVDVPASVATDLAGSSNAAADRLSIAVDRTAPTPVIATTAADPTSLESIPFTVDFGESMTPDEFVAAEITLSSGTVTGFATSDDQEFAFNVIEADEGVLTVDVPASVATDLAGSSNAAADRLSIAVDRTAPTPVIATTAADPTSLESIPFTVDFGESMTPDEFVAAEITLSSGTVTGFATSDDQEFAFNVIEADEGVLTVDVPASVATDLAGSSNAAADRLSIAVDRTAPTPVIATTAADPTSLESIPFTVDFGESMTPDEFVAAEITLSSGTVTGFATSDDQEFAFNVIEADEGVLTVDVPASVATDLAGSSNAAADRLSIAVDRTAPTPVIATTAADPTSLESIPFTVDFGESMTPDEFVAAEITLSSGTVTGFATSDDQEFAFNVIEADEGVLTVDVPASVATDLAGSSNAAADRLSIAVDRTAPTPVIATTAADPTSLESIPFTVDFGESMTPDEFVAAEITLSSGTVTGFATSDDQEFAFNVIEADEGVLTVDVPASVATDLAGSSNAAADRLSIAVDRTAPTPVIATTAADPTSLESIPFTVDFGESMTPDEFVAAEITLSSGTVTGFATSDDQEFAFNVIEADEGVLTVDVPASVATDLAGSSNAAADRLSIAVDRTAPTPVIATTAADPTSLESIPFTVDFGESMTPDEFVAAEITLSSGTVTGFATSDDQEFAFNVIEADEGVLTVDVPASVATDLAGSSNAAADRLSIAVDRTAPTPVIATTAADPTSLESIPFTVDFGESMTPDEFVAAEITLSSGTVTGFATSDDQEFAFNVIEADEGVLTVDVPASVATDLAGSSNAAADRLSIAVDRTAPTPVIATTAADPTSLESIPFTVDFGESMTPDEFVAAEITLSSGNVIDFTPDSANQLFTFNVTSADDGEDLTVDVAASVATRPCRQQQHGSRPALNSSGQDSTNTEPRHNILQQRQQHAGS